MKVFSGALVALFVSAPAFASVTFNLPKDAGVQFLTKVSTGETVINALMPDGSTQKIMDTTRAQIESEMPLVQAFWNGSDDYDQGSQYNANSNVYNGGGHYRRVRHHHVEDDTDEIIDDRYPSGQSSSVNQSNRQTQRQQNQRGPDGPAYGYGGAPGYGPGPGYGGGYQQPLPPITRAPYDGYGNGGF